MGEVDQGIKYLLQLDAANMLPPGIFIVSSSSRSQRVISLHQA